jgi:hypothetical protein
MTILALQQLQRLDKKVAKYRHVSDDFLKRHEIGIYSKTKVASLQDVSKIIDKERTRSYDLPAHKDMREDAESFDDDTDWVVEALTVQQPSRKRPSIQPSITIDVGSNHEPSIGIGFELDFGSKPQHNVRRDIIAKAITMDSKRRDRRTINSNQQQHSNADSIIDRFRAATGTDSIILSRTILGAYPGDAPPISEAANSNGLIDLARKYGYGDWSDDDDENDVEHGMKLVSNKQKRQGKQRRIHSDGSDIEGDWWRQQSKANVDFKPKRISFSIDLSSSDTKVSANRRPSNKKDGNIARSLMSRKERSDDVPSLILQRRFQPSVDKQQGTVAHKFHGATEILANRRERLLRNLRNRDEKDDVVK